MTGIVVDDQLTYSNECPDAPGHYWARESRVGARAHVVELADIAGARGVLVPGVMGHQDPLHYEWGPWVPPPWAKPAPPQLPAGELLVEIWGTTGSGKSTLAIGMRDILLHHWMMSHDKVVIEDETASDGRPAKSAAISATVAQLRRVVVRTRQAIRARLESESEAGA